MSESENKMKLNVKGFLIGLVAFAMSSSSVLWASEPTAEDFNVAFAAANEARKMASEAGHEWRDTGKILKSAQESAQQGDLAKAMKLVATAQLQSDAAIFQAERESTLWESRVIR